MPSALLAMENGIPKPHASGYILQNKVSHARHLPTSAAHAFTYPTLALLLSLSALESHQLDLGHGRFFGYNDATSRSSTYASWARVTGIRPEAYLHDYHSEDQQGNQKSIRKKLEDVLMRFGHDPGDLADAWMLTMPSYFGVEGINPLTVFYCYNRPRDEDRLSLWLVVLEVHNTFGERHVYVLPAETKHEDKDTRPGYTHSWTFPRQFHVSPFNDRSGYYTCSIVAPSHSPPQFSPSSLVENYSENPRLPTIKIQLCTADRELKLTAILRSRSAVPLTTGNLLESLAKYPLTLLLSFPRIAWQAFHLHHGKRLDVYARPEPRAVDQALEKDFVYLTTLGDRRDENGIDASLMLNEVQRDGEDLGIGGGVGWQPEGILERYARHCIERFIEVRAQTTGIRVRLLSTSPLEQPRSFPQHDTSPNSDKDLGDTFDSESYANGGRRELILITRSPRAFLLILSSPSPAHALLLARDAERILAVSDDSLFLKLFSLNINANSKNRREERDAAISLLTTSRMLQWIRTLPVPRTLLPSSRSREGELAVPDVHPLDLAIIYRPSSAPSAVSSSTFDFMFSIQTLLVISAFVGLKFVEKAIFKVFRARFVKGTEPWGAWTRAEEVWLARTRRKD